MKQVQSKTLEIKKEIINKLVSGSTFREVRKYLQDTYNYHQRSADKLIAATSKELREHYEKYVDNMAAYNLTRLTEIINEMLLSLEQCRNNIEVQVVYSIEYDT